MAFQPGDKLKNGKYTIERELGKGRFGVTYLAKDAKEQKWVIKTLSDDLLNQLTQPEIDRLQDKFWQEAVNLANCKHPHIVKIKEIFREGQLVCLVMEYIPGKDLAKLPTKIWSEAEILPYIRQIGEALQVVHENGLVHRDIKPDNIMIRSPQAPLNKGGEEAVLIDFGLAKGFDNPLTTVNSTSVDGFAPIELYDVNAERGAYTDVYSLAATLYFLLTKEVPPSAEKRSRNQAKLVPPKQINSQISDKVDQAIREGMRLAPEERPQTMQEWLNLLGLKSAKVKLPNWNTLDWLVAMGAIAAVIPVIVGFLAWLKPNSPPTENPPTLSLPAQVTPNK